MRRIAAEVTDANAMTLSTVDAAGQPSARIVLLKGFDAAGFVFFTNYESKKAADLATNAQVALHFFWPDLQRQIAILGTAAKTTRRVSEAYFATRPIEAGRGWGQNNSGAERPDSRRAWPRREKLRGRSGPPFWAGLS